MSASLTSRLGAWLGRLNPLALRRAQSMATLRAWFRGRSIEEWATPALTFALSLAGLLLGCLSLGTNAIDMLPVPMLGLLCLSLLFLGLHTYHLEGHWDRTTLILAGLALALALLLQLLPEYSYSVHVHGIVHRSVFSALFLIPLAIAAACSSLYYLLGATPQAEDLSRYPPIVAPVLLILAAYVVILAELVGRGLGGLTLKVLITPYNTGMGQAGLGKHIAGTLLLVALTAAISLPIGVGVGVYLSEYAQGFLGRAVGFATTALRSISVFILGLSAAGLVTLARGTFLSDLLCGYSFAPNGAKITGDGTYVTAAIFLSLLVIPIIARATEEGCRSLPQILREGSWALAASEAYTLRRIVLPWALPNIITGLLLGCAEAAGSVAVIMFLAKTMDQAISPLGRVTSLSYVIFEIRQGANLVKRLLSPYQFTAALILVFLTMGLSIAALVLKRRLGARYRGT